MNDVFSMIFDSEKNTNAEQGINNSPLIEPSNQFKYDRTDSETVYSGQNNTWIVLGRDRPSGVETGFGAKGHEKCGAIDIVAGRLSHVDARTLKGSLVNSNTFADAARVYISQKSNIDSYHMIADGKTGQTVATSAALIKADDVRLIARNSMKLVTKTDPYLSNGEAALSNVGIQLIANNDDRDMQPIPKGDNLRQAFVELTEKVLELNGIVKAFMDTQLNFNNQIAQHYHISPFNAQPTSPSFPVKAAGKAANLQLNLKVDQQLKNHANNLVSFHTKYLFASSKYYINSAYHFLN